MEHVWQVGVAAEEVPRGRPRICATWQRGSGHGLEVSVFCFGDVPRAFFCCCWVVSRSFKARWMVRLYLLRFVLMVMLIALCSSHAANVAVLLASTHAL